MIELCARIQSECKRQDRSLHSVLTKAKLGPSIFYKWQNGSKPRAKSITAIANVLKVAPEQLCPELTETFSTLNESRSETIDDSRSDSDDVVFIGVTQRMLNHLRPLLESANARFIELSVDASRGLRGMFGEFTNPLTSPLAA